jgi:hypothetical protein
MVEIPLILAILYCCVSYIYALQFLVLEIPEILYYTLLNLHMYS